MKVLRFPRHKKWVCTDEHDDGGIHCGFCNGGLFFCVTCKGAEGSLTTDCPGERMSPEVERRVLCGQLDYTTTLGWHEPASRERRG